MPVGARDLGAQAAVLALRKGFQRALDDHHQAVGLERLFDEVIGPALQALTAVSILPWPEIMTTGRSGSSSLTRSSSSSPSRPPPCIQISSTSQRRFARADGGQGLVGVRGDAHGVAFVLEQARNQLADVRLVVDDQDVGSGGSHIASLSAAGTAPPDAFASFDPAGAFTWDFRGKIRHTRAPDRVSASASFSSPPCSSQMRLTMARPRPVPFSRVVT
jgi:hypothetical protein